jgi:hypothetical protein
MRLFSCFLAAMLLTELPPVIALAATAQSNIAFTVTSPTRLGGGVLPADLDASANWQIAGMLSVGGIPNRTTVCATVSPLGGGKDDTANIQNAVNACPLGQVVSLAAGTFIIAEGKYVLVNKGITLRGAGPGVTILHRTDGAGLGSYIPVSSPSPMIIVGPQRYNNDETATALTADAAQGMNSVQVTSTAGFSVGQIVLMERGVGRRLADRPARARTDLGFSRFPGGVEEAQPPSALR